ncbi:hypothetical protein HOL34_01635 [bacterium]|jgi:hypothetical protein|nr:hypothetical protein [bacterium]MBT3903623.1 hypothetical protein [bacterium]MBT4577908.1 hypothetical protein [bacterium]MBT5345931.1 hypothetical protein [bacterium]MBT6131121.1 hypothetical protein [bacterium]
MTLPYLSRWYLKSCFGKKLSFEEIKKMPYEAFKNVIYSKRLEENRWRLIGLAQKGTLEVDMIVSQRKEGWFIEIFYPLTANCKWDYHENC